MQDFKYFLSALRGAHSMLERDRKGLYRSAATRPIHQELKDRYARGLRRSAAKLTELDVDVMEDLMKIVKKLGKASTTTGTGLELRLKLTLDLIDHVISRTTPATPDHLLWLFNKIYYGLMNIVPDEAPQPVAGEVVA